MSFVSGTITGANPGVQLQAAIRAIVDAHPAWEFVKETNPGAVTGQELFRCLGALNSAGVDFFVNFGRDTGSVLYAQVFEEWDGNNTMRGWTPQVQSATQTPAADGRINSTLLLTSGPSTAATQSNVSFNTASFAYWISVSNDRIVLGTTSGGTDYSCYVGAYDRFYDAALDPFPLIGCRLSIGSQSSSANGHFTRELIPISAITYTWSAAVIAYENAAGHNGSSVQDTVLSAAAGAPRYLATRLVVANASPNRVVARGLLKDVRHCYPGISPLNGDTIQIDGETYTYIKSNTSSNAVVCVRNAA